MVIGGLTIAIAAMALGVVQDSAATRARAVELVDERFWERLHEVPGPRRDPDWQLLSALGRLARGESEDALEIGRRLARAGSPRGYLLEQFLRVHDEDPAALAAPPPEPWRDNPAVNRATNLLRWTDRRLGTRLSEFSYLLRVEHQGAWPGESGHHPRRGALARTPRERLRWLNERRDTLLRALAAGAGAQKVRTPASRHWLLVTQFRAGAELRAFAEEDARLAELLGERAPVFLWIREIDGSESERRLSSLDGFPAPLFVATTRRAVHLQTPGFERGGVTILVDPELRIRLVIDRWLPVPILHRTIADLMGK